MLTSRSTSLIPLGVLAIIAGIRLRRTGQALHSVLHDAPPEPGRA